MSLETDLSLFKAKLILRELFACTNHSRNQTLICTSITDVNGIKR